MKGYFGIGCINMKNQLNYGTLFRSADLFNADFVFLIGKRFKQQASDTMKSWKNMPVFNYLDFDDFQKHRPHGGLLIGIEMCEKSRPIKSFVHPDQAIYLLGAEDTGLTAEAIKACKYVVQLPGERSMNVAVAGSIVMFDRLQKQ
jgi:tRNA G18 (ribose-2'-O)-methylase SpoU